MTAAIRAFAPGRTELAGNHTDHQGGRAIAATLDCGINIAFERNGGKRIRFASEGFEPFEIDIDAGASGPRVEEAGTTAALVRGVVDLLAEAGLEVGGFDATASSTIPSGGGLSSSAALELALICGLQELFGSASGNRVVCSTRPPSPTVGSPLSISRAIPRRRSLKLSTSISHRAGMRCA